MKLLLAISITLNMYQAVNAAGAQGLNEKFADHRPDSETVRTMDLSRIASATLDSMADDSGLSVYEYCNPKHLVPHVEYIEKTWNRAAYANSLIESCDRLNFNYN